MWPGEWEHDVLQSRPVPKTSYSGNSGISSLQRQKPHTCNTILFGTSGMQPGFTMLGQKGEDWAWDKVAGGLGLHLQSKGCIGLCLKTYLGHSKLIATYQAPSALSRLCLLLPRAINPQFSRGHGKFT
ncbi:hypothetical protein RRG08_063945 [Elysia crispata]|uniref:Uncharacterized protein n=1 Tax=Elysia crispata TaxID=231223 RepID=A0AAE1CY02_9GAST|nr:hypothetical protein RRG08_063945 [Elysia crispata]